MTDTQADLPDLQSHLRPYVKGVPGVRWINAPYFETLRWAADAAEAGVSMGELANHVDAQERALNRINWLVEDHRDYVARHTQSFRLQAVLELFARYGAYPDDPNATVSADLGIAVRAAWKLGHIYQHADTWRWIISALRRSGFDMMTPEERDVVSRMPDNQLVFRGFSVPLGLSAVELHSAALGFSWTPLRSVGAFFASVNDLAADVFYRTRIMKDDEGPGERPAGQYIATAMVSRHHVAAMFAEKFELVIHDPLALSAITVEQIPSRAPEDALAACLARH